MVALRDKDEVVTAGLPWLEQDFKPSPISRQWVALKSGWTAGLWLAAQIPAGGWSVVIHLRGCYCGPYNFISALMTWVMGCSALSDVVSLVDRLIDHVVVLLFRGTLAVWRTEQGRIYWSFTTGSPVSGEEQPHACEHSGRWRYAMIEPAVFVAEAANSILGCSRRLRPEDHRCLFFPLALLWQGCIWRSVS